MTTLRAAIPARVPYRRSRIRDLSLATVLGLAILLAGLLMADATGTAREPQSSNPRVDAASPATEIPPDGAVFHYREEVFARHGAAASEIASWEGLGTLPERYVRESWLLVDGQSRMIEGIAEVRDLDGRLVQRSRVTVDAIVVEDIQTGETLRQDRAQPSAPLTAPPIVAEEAWNHFKAAAEAGAMGTSQVGDAAGAVTVIFYERSDAPSVDAGVETSVGEASVDEVVTIPYLRDLDIVAIEKRFAFRDSDRAPLYEETVAILADGSQVTVESTHWLAMDMLPSGQWDAIVAGASGAEGQE